MRMCEELDIRLMAEGVEMVVDFGLGYAIHMRLNVGLEVVVGLGTLVGMVAEVDALGSTRWRIWWRR